MDRRLLRTLWRAVRGQEAASVLFCAYSKTCDVKRYSQACNTQACSFESGLCAQKDSGNRHCINYNNIYNYIIIYNSSWKGAVERQGP